MPKTEIIIPDEIITAEIQCDNCSLIHKIRFIKNQVCITFVCKSCKKIIGRKNNIVIIKQQN